jgi:twitching motility protein PilJ
VHDGQDEISGRQKMESSIDDYLEIYQQARTAYVQAKYEEAATLIHRAVQNLPNDPGVRLLQGHIHYVLQQFDLAAEEYQKVLELTDNEELTDFARNGLDNINQFQLQLEVQVTETNNKEQINFVAIPSSENIEQEELEDNEASNNFSSADFDLGSRSEYQEAVDEINNLASISPFDISTDISVLDSSDGYDLSENYSDNPFAISQIETDETPKNTNEKQAELELPSFWQQDIPSSSGYPELDLNSNSPTNSANFAHQSPSPNQSDFQFVEIDFSQNDSSEISLEKLEENVEEPNINTRKKEEDLQFQSKIVNTNDAATNIEEDSNLEIFAKKSYSDNNESFQQQQLKSASKPQQHNFDDDSFDLEAFESAFGSDAFIENDETSGLISASASNGSNIEFLDDFDEFDDLGNIPGFELTEESSFSTSKIRSSAVETNGKSPNKTIETKPHNNEIPERDSELFSITGSHESVPVFTQSDIAKLEPQVNVEQGILAPLENAPLQTKQWFTAGAVGIVSALSVAVVSFSAANLSASEHRESLRNTGWIMTLTAGIAGFATTGLMGNLTINQIRRATKDLQTQFDAVRQGNLSVQATVYSEDEFGQLASGFNEMARVIFTTTNEATRKAQEQEEAKENLQRQVIRLLDDVEGAARGDLTVQAEVTADVLGAVADAFNLTIQNLRDIVQQVKVAAKEVTKGATNSETFARALSSDALRQAEELAVTLNSVQVMTDSIQRVAEAAREAEAVARDASTIALKGGEAVENTVAGILEIRETVAETTRKVKRLAESSQEISKIVALISQIASRTNLLALNASIEAARAGEAGRGFAIVADEVRQLADKSAKSLKEIEQIVMQIQSETGSVMTAMEEGTQQVIKGTKLAEEAKRSLENIIQVANRIDILVRSITTDTVEQTETSRAVAQVMQSVELTAQETSQEAQRVSGALQHLVSVSRDLIASVERFRVETAEVTR